MNNNENYNIRIILATAISTILMFGWMKYYGNETISVSKEKQEIIAENTKSDLNIEKEDEIQAVLENNDILNLKDLENIKEFRLNINTKNLKGSINLKGLIFDDLILEQYNQAVNSTEKVRLLYPEKDANAYFVKFGWISTDKTIDLPTEATIWQADLKELKINAPVTLSYKNKNNITFQLVLSIDENYMFNIQQNVINNSDKVVVIKIFNNISKKIGTEINNAVSVHEGFIGAFVNKIEEIKYKKLTKKNFNFDSNIGWAGFTNTYWLVALSTLENQRHLFNVNTEYKNKDYIINFESENLVLNSESKDSVTNLLFAGPKILKLLDSYAFSYQLPFFDRAVDFGWFYFLTKPIYIVLKFFYAFFQNFGVAILFLTFVIKLIMYPFTKKSFISMAKMKDLQPKVEELKAKYSDDKLKMNREMVSLYKRENVNPLSGCLPMLIQIPVFFSLYKVLVISIDMRQAPFFGYIKNLAEKDPTTLWNLFGLLPFQVSFLQIGFLPCLMCFTMWIQQKMSSQINTNPEAQMVTKFMPILFLFMFASMPAGLLIYWTFSNIITIGQQYYVEQKIKKSSKGFLMNLFKKK